MYHDDDEEDDDAARVLLVLCLHKNYCQQDPLIIQLAVVLNSVTNINWSSRDPPPSPRILSVPFCNTSELDGRRPLLLWLHYRRDPVRSDNGLLLYLLRLLMI